MDFGALRQAAEESGAPVFVHGPIPQGGFLLRLGIEARLEQLIQVTHRIGGRKGYAQIKVQ